MIKYKITPLNVIMQMIKEQQNKRIFIGNYECGSHLPLVLRPESAWVKDRLPI